MHENDGFAYVHYPGYRVAALRIKVYVKRREEENIGWLITLAPKVL